MKKSVFILLSLIVTVIILITVTSYKADFILNENKENVDVATNNKPEENNSTETKPLPLENNAEVEKKEPEIKDNEIVVDEKTTDETIKQIVEEMTLEEKVGQMFIVVPETFSKSSPVTDFSQLNVDKIKKYNVGGFILFTKNINNPKQLTEFTSNIDTLNSEVGMFISIDEEGGQVARISNNSNFPDKRFENMSEVGRTEDYDRALEIGDTMGKYLTNYGFNLNFAPVCDVLLNPKNTVVSKRSFGSDGEVVANMSLNVMKGLKANNILACAKHFPGHGNTSLDTHDGFATSDATLEEMKSSELVPFKKMIENDVDMMMISHVIYPNLSEEQVPATLNYDIITELLKNQLGYTGVVITDGMNMGAIQNNYSVSKSTVMAVKAGVDIILMPSDFYVAYDSIIDAINNGDISEERINESVTKIIKLKYEKFNAK